MPNSNTLNRRRFLRGAGASIAIPTFASLVPIRSALADTVAPATTATGAPLRMAFMSIPNGVQQDHWFPEGDGKEFSLNETMKPLEPVKQHLQVISGLAHQNATPGNDGAGDHARANATFLTGARARKTAGKDIHVGISIDQVAAQKFGHVTRFPSLELSCDAIRNSGSCDSGYACAYQYCSVVSANGPSVIWRSPLRTRTDVAVVTEWSGAESSHFPSASNSFAISIDLIMHALRDSSVQQLSSL